MEIEVARLHRLDNGSAIKAFVDVIFNGQLLVKGVRIVEGKNGLFVTMPQAQSTKDNKWYPTTMLLDDGLKEELQSAVLEAYQA